MRMMKRLAVCVLAAAMSLTMLTACDGDTPSAPANPSNPGTSQGSGSGNDNGNNNGGNNNGQKPGNEDENTLPTTWYESKTKVYYETKGVSSTNYLIQAQLATDYNYSYAQNVTYAVANKKRLLEVVSGTYRESIYQNSEGTYFVKENSEDWTQIEDDEEINNVNSRFERMEKIFVVPNTNNVTYFKAQSQKSGEDTINYESISIKGQSYTFAYMNEKYLAEYSTFVEDEDGTTVYTVFPTNGGISQSSVELFPDL